MKKLVRRVLSWVPDRVYLTIRYIYRFRRLPDLSRPRRFNENIIALMLSDQDYELRRIFADKIEANRYIERVVGKDYITPVIDVITPESLNNFNFDQLPDRFVAKTAHASGFVEVVRDKKNCDETALIETFRDWVKIDFHSYCRERVYKNLPKRIVIEEFLNDRVTGDVPLDYKVFVFRGGAKMLQIDLSRFEGHRRVLMDRNWSPYPCRLK